MSLKKVDPIAIKIGLAVLCTPLLSACFENAQIGKSSATATSSAASASLTPASGVMAAKIIFQSTAGGSFDASPAGGTIPANAGQRATRVFLPNNTLLSSGGYTDSNWPKWLNFVEIGISGANNTAATNPECARFAGAADAAAVCDFDGDAGAVTAGVGCGAPTNYYRVSEFDCTAATAGKGDSSDGVYIRASFSRNTTKLAGYENILAVLEYVASTISPSPATPTTCFTGGVFTPENTGCSDMTWKAYLRNAASLLPTPFMLVVPPAYAYVNALANNMSGTGVATKQFYLPLATDATLDTFQISRIQARTTFLNATTGNVICSADSAMCVGMVFNSITFYRM